MVKNHWKIEHFVFVKIQNTLHTKTTIFSLNHVDILCNFIMFLQNFNFGEIHIFQNRCILMQLCYKNFNTWNICLIEFLHQSMWIIAPCFEVCKHASAHLHVQTMAKYHYNVASSLFAYISYKVCEFLKHSFIKCNSSEKSNYGFDILQSCKN